MESREENSRNNWFKSKIDKIKTDIVHIGHLSKQIAQDDPLKVVHSFKVGLAIALVSLFYYFYPLYEGFGVDAMWAVLTVVVVFEFSVGSTLGKGVNRVVATVVGGMSAVGAHMLTSMILEELEPLLLGFSVFITAAIATFIRFFPKIKGRFDYGMQIFILTFSLICVSGYRDDEVLDQANRRISTILIGSSTAVLVCVFICPVWAGTDLHKLTASNIHILGIFFEEFGDAYFRKSDAISKDDNRAFLNGVKNVIESKNNIDTLYNFARWEPRHGPFKLRHPWQQYQKIGDVTRNCACTAKVLHDFLHSQAPKEVKGKFQDACMKMSTETSKALTELSLAITKKTQPLEAKPHIQNAKQAVQNLNLLLRSDNWKNHRLSDVTQAVTIASLLTDVVFCTEEIAEAVQELASLAKFENVTDARDSPSDDKSKLATQESFNDHVVVIDDPTPSNTPTRSPAYEDPPSLAMCQQFSE